MTVADAGSGVSVDSEAGGVDGSGTTNASAGAVLESGVASALAVEAALRTAALIAPYWEVGVDRPLRRPLSESAGGDKFLDARREDPLP